MFKFAYVDKNAYLCTAKCALGSPKILIFGESGGIGCPFIKRSGINPCKPIVERDA